MTRDHLQWQIANYQSLMGPGSAFAVTQTQLEDAGFTDPESFVDWLEDVGLAPKTLTITLDVTGNVLFTYPKIDQTDVKDSLQRIVAERVVDHVFG